MLNKAGLITGQITLSIDGESLQIEMTVPVEPVKPTRMLPVFQKVSKTFRDRDVKAEESRGNNISCRKGCAACCRQAVPVSEIEAYQIAELVESMDEPQREKIKKRFAQGVRHFRKIGWFERLKDCVRLNSVQQNKVFTEYFEEYVDCPFLEDEICLIHQKRPFACREYLVTSPPENCSHPTAETVKTVKMPFKISHASRLVFQSGYLKKINFIPLIRALEWTEKHPDKMPKKTGQQWMADFFRFLTGSKIPAK